jgi:DNA-directed RNA polymerase specialized sigma subunit
MDITLKRIVEELKLKKIKKTDLTNYLGFSSSAIFGNWISGRNTSYLKYLHAIASYLDVSVEYLKGETDIKKTPIDNDERLDEIYELVKNLDESEQMALKAFVAGLKANRKPQ